MVAVSRCLAAAVALVTASTTLAMPLGNATLDARAPADLTCGADRAPMVGLASADERHLKPGVGVAAPGDRVINVYWLVRPRHVCASS